MIKIKKILILRNKYLFLNINVYRVNVLNPVANINLLHIEDYLVKTSDHYENLLILSSLPFSYTCNDSNYGRKFYALLMQLYKAIKKFGAAVPYQKRASVVSNSMRASLPLNYDVKRYSLSIVTFISKSVSLTT